jgi:D-glycero-D-manno-heptose 1,7-bisphosphate phosphatase
MAHWRLIIFDLDGTLTSLRLSPVHDAPLILLPNVRVKLATLSAGQAILAVATNQVTGRFRGRPYTCAVIEDRLDALAKLLPMIPRRLMRVGRPRTGSWKPSPGMLMALLRDTATDEQAAMLVGDSESDRQAADNAGMAFAWAWDYFGWPNGRADHSIDWRVRGADIWRTP